MRPLLQIILYINVIAGENEEHNCSENWIQEKILNIICTVVSEVWYFVYSSVRMFRQVLNSILNPNLPIGEGLFDPEKENENLEKDQVPEMVLNLERLGRFAAEKGEIEESLAFFTKVLSFHNP